VSAETPCGGSGAGVYPSIGRRATTPKRRPAPTGADRPGLETEHAERAFLRTAAGLPGGAAGERHRRVDWLQRSPRSGPAAVGFRCTRTPSPALPRTG